MVYGKEPEAVTISGCQMLDREDLGQGNFLAVLKRWYLRRQMVIQICSVNISINGDGMRIRGRVGRVSLHGLSSEVSGPTNYPEPEDNFMWVWELWNESVFS